MENKIRNNRNENQLRTNHEITADKVRVVTLDGEVLGVMDVPSAVTEAKKRGLDLVEVSPNVKPPVCKILDHGKYKYEQQKKANEAKKKQKIVKTKEIKLRPNTDSHDLETKLKAARKFIENGDKIKFSIRFRGREMAHQEVGLNQMKKVIAALEGITKLELAPKMENRQMLMILIPDANAAVKPVVNKNDSVQNKEATSKKADS